MHLLLALLLQYLCLNNDHEAAGNKLHFDKPDNFILYTGQVVFCAAVCEGGIYDWSSVYFREVVQIKLFTLSYLVFMISMTLSQFFTDTLVEMIGIKKMFMISALLVVLGVLILIVFPTFYPVFIRFYYWFGSGIYFSCTL